MPLSIGKHISQNVGDKPPFSYTQRWGLNRRHPLVGNLQAAYLCNEMAGNVIHDLTRKNDSATFEANVAGWEERGIDFGSAGSSADVNLPSTIDTTGAFSLIFRFKFSVADTTANRYFFYRTMSHMMRYTQSGWGPIFYWEFYDGAWQNFSLGFSSGYVGKWVTIGLSRASATADIYGYLDGINVATESALTGGLSGTGVIETNRSDEDNALDYIYYFDRGLSDAEMFDVYADPYAMFRHEDTLLFGAAIAAEGPAASVVPFRRRIEGY